VYSCTVGNVRLNANGSHYYLIYSKLFHKGIVNIFKWMPKYWSFNSCSLELNSKLFFLCFCTPRLGQHTFTVNTVQVFYVIAVAGIQLCHEICIQNWKPFSLEWCRTCSKCMPCKIDIS